MNDEDILPCPVCGSAAAHHINMRSDNKTEWTCWVGCRRSGCMSGPVYNISDDNAIAAWNRLSRAERLMRAVEALTARPGDLCVSHEYRGRMTFVDRLLTLDGTRPTLWKCYSGTASNPEGADHGQYPTLIDALIALGGQE